MLAHLFFTHQICVKNPTMFIQEITFLSLLEMSGLQQKQICKDVLLLTWILPNDAIMKTNSVFLALNTSEGINLERNVAKLEQLRFISHSFLRRVHKIFHAE